MGKRKSKWFSAFMAAVLLFGGIWPGLGLHKAKAAGPAIIYVKMETNGGSDGNDGDSWDEAYATLQQALDNADDGDQIWMAAGTYYPTENGIGRERHFEMKNGVAIYGGFKGDKDSDLSLDDRNYTTHKTILSGDFDGSDANKAYHVFYHENLNLDQTAILDGVTITGGNANGEDEHDSGGGMLNYDNSSPTLTNVTISGNKAANSGGGIINYNSSPNLTNVTISSNTASMFGGGMFNLDNSSPTLISVMISGNTAAFGGGLINYDNSSPTLTNVTISGNTATFDGGGLANYDNSSPTLTNVTISGNKADSVSGMYNTDESKPNIRNSIIWGNISISGYNVFDDSSEPNIDHCLIEGSKGSGNSWDTDYGVDGGGNIDENPMFQDFKLVNIEPTTEGNYRLRSYSPAIDIGDKNVFDDGLDPDLSGIHNDLGGKPRIMGAQVDMGAFEYQGSATTITGLTASPTPVNLSLGQTDSQQLSVKATLSDTTSDNVTSFILGTTYTSGDITIATVTLNGLIEAKKAGTTTITIANSGTTTTVEVNVTSTSTSSSGGWVSSGDTHLRELTVRSDGKTLPLTPVFVTDTTEYSIETAALQVDLTGIAVHSSAIVTLQGKTLKDGIRVDLHEGDNVFAILVTAENGATKTYTLTVKRIKAGQEPPRKPVSFTDIHGHWAEVSILQAATKGIVNGYPDSTFRPNNSVTRAEFVVILVNAMKLNHSGSTSQQISKDLDASLAFTDEVTIGAWAKETVVYAVQAGIVNGYKDGSFRPNARITRSEMVLMIAHALGLALDANAATPFADDAAIPVWAKSAVEATRKLGIVNGRGGNRFVPMGEATRAEATVLLLRMLEYKGD